MVSWGKVFVPGPRYLESRRVPREEVAMLGVGARPKAMATSWTD